MDIDGLNTNEESSLEVSKEMSLGIGKIAGFTRTAASGVKNFTVGAGRRTGEFASNTGRQVHRAGKAVGAGLVARPKIAMLITALGGLVAGLVGADATNMDLVNPNAGSCLDCYI